MRTNEKCAVLLMLMVAAICAACLCGCTSTTYNVTIHPDAIKYADTVTLEPGQGGDSVDSSALESAAEGGEGASPGSNIINRGFADYGVIFNLGATPQTTATTDANLEASVPLK